VNFFENFQGKDNTDFWANLSNFNHFNNLKAFARFVRSQSELIVYPVGEVGNEFLEYLQYSNLYRRFTCIATDKLAGNNIEQRFSHLLPLVSLESLVTFKDSGTFIVVAPAECRDTAYQTLLECMGGGFKKLVVTDDNFQGFIKKELEKQRKSKQHRNWFMDHILKMTDELGYRIAEQNETAEINQQAFASYKDKFLGKKIVILANGPTLKYYKPMPDAIHIGINLAWMREDIKLDFLFAQDYMPGNYRFKIKEGFDRISEAIFVCGRFTRSVMSPMVFPESFFFKFDKLVRFAGSHTENYYTRKPIFFDISNYQVSPTLSTTFVAMRFALYTHPKEIYLVGADTTATGHFYDDDDEDNDAGGFGVVGIHRAKLLYGKLKMFARRFYPDVEIISINPVALKDLFKNVYTEDYLLSMENEGK